MTKVHRLKQQPTKTNNNDDEETRGHFTGIPENVCHKETILTKSRRKREEGGVKVGCEHGYECITEVNRSRKSKKKESHL